MKKVWMCVFVCTASLVWQVACEPEPTSEKFAEKSADGGADGGVLVDIAPPDASAPDTPAPEQPAPDKGAPDATPDATPDVTLDATPDVTSDVTPDPNSAKQKAFWEHLDKRHEALCALYHERCCSKELTPLMQMTFGTDKADCNAKFKDSKRYPFDFSRADIDSTALDKCLATVKASSCKEFNEVQVACRLIYVPLQEHNEPCQQSFECKSGLYCTNSVPGLGFCYKLLGEGLKCKVGDSSCVAGTRCLAVDASRPLDTTCTKGPVAGEACNSTEQRCSVGLCSEVDNKCSEDRALWFCAK